MVFNIFKTSWEISCFNLTTKLHKSHHFKLLYHLPNTWLWFIYNTMAQSFIMKCIKIHHLSQTKKTWNIFPRKGNYARVQRKEGTSLYDKSTQLQGMKSPNMNTIYHNKRKDRIRPYVDYLKIESYFIDNVTLLIGPPAPSSPESNESSLNLEIRY